MELGAIVIDFGAINVNSGAILPLGAIIIDIYGNIPLYSRSSFHKILIKKDIISHYYD